MTLESSLYTQLSTYAGLTALVGTRVYPKVLPLGVTLPAVSYERVSGVRTTVPTRAVVETSARMQVSAWAGDYLTARAVAAQVRAALMAWTTTPAAEVDLAGDYDFYEQEAQVYQVTTDALVLVAGDG